MSKAFVISINERSSKESRCKNNYFKFFMYFQILTTNITLVTRHQFGELRWREDATQRNTWNRERQCDHNTCIVHSVTQTSQLRDPGLDSNSDCSIRVLVHKPQSSNRASYNNQLEKAGEKIHEI